MTITEIEKKISVLEKQYIGLLINKPDNRKKPLLWYIIFIPSPFIMLFLMASANIEVEIISELISDLILHVNVLILFAGYFSVFYFLDRIILRRKQYEKDISEIKTEIITHKDMLIEKLKNGKYEKDIFLRNI